MGSGVVKLFLRYTELRERLLLGHIKGQAQLACQSPAGYAQFRRDLLDAHVRRELIVSQALPVRLT